MEQTNIDKDPVLWELAKKRASFKKSLSSYLLVNMLLWIIWYFTSYNTNMNNDRYEIPWPIWSTIGWGIGIAFQYVSAYVSPKTLSEENEYQKLKNKQS